MVQRALEVSRRLDVDRDAIGAGLAKLVHVALRLDDHQMNVERELRRGAHGAHDKRANGDVGDEPAIHHIDVDPIGAGSVDRSHLLGELSKVCGQNGGGDLDRAHALALARLTALREAASPPCSASARRVTKSPGKSACREAAGLA